MIMTRITILFLILALTNAISAAEEQVQLTEAAKKNLQQMVDGHQLVMEVQLKAGEFTGAVMMHEAKITKQLKGKLRDGAIFASLNAKDEKVPVSVKPAEKPLPELEAGHYVVILEAHEIINSLPGIRIPLIGTVMAPKPSYNYFTHHDDDSHCAWPVGSAEAQYVRQFTKY